MEEKKEVKRKVIKATKDKAQIEKERLEKLEKNPIKILPIEAKERLSEIANDSCRYITIKGEKHPIYALKMGTQWLITEESIKIAKAETSNMSDVLKQFAINIPSVIHCLTLAILNDKDRIFINERKREYTDEYYQLYESIEWEGNPEEWMRLISEVFSMINIEVFFYTTEMIATIREMMTNKKKTMKEAKLFQQGQSGV